MGPGSKLATTTRQTTHHFASCSIERTIQIDFQKANIPIRLSVNSPPSVPPLLSAKWDKNTKKLLAQPASMQTTITTCGAVERLPTTGWLAVCCIQTSFKIKALLIANQNLIQHTRLKPPAHHTAPGCCYLLIGWVRSG